MKKKTKVKIQEQVYSFVKTYVVTFLAIILMDTTKITDPQYLEKAAMASLVVLLRNIYKLLTE